MADSDSTSTKVCTKCDLLKSKTLFSARKASKDGFMVWCKSCMKNYQAERRQDPQAKANDDASNARWLEANKGVISTKNAQRYLENKEEILARNKAWSEANKEKHDLAIKRWSERNKPKRAQYVADYRARNPEKIIAYTRANVKAQHARAKAWRANNKDRARETERVWSKNKRLTDPVFVVKDRMRARINMLFRGVSKSKRTLEILGCSWEFLLIHIERQFAKGMTWANRGEWHIDHIQPLAIASNEEELVALNHFTNIRPLWAKENLLKGDRVTHLI